jgi:phosphoglycolate phosphatase-like HAD superfamily hydrolase
VIYIFDIDGTIADISHRLHFIQTPEHFRADANWRGFFAACDEDKPITEVVTILQCLSSEGHFIVLITGRSDECKEKTLQWMSDQMIDFDLIYMRKEGDHRQDHIVKSELLDRYIEEFHPPKIDGVFEDRKQVVDMYRARGLRVFQVAEGDF